MTTVKIKDKGQVTVPKELREKLGLSVGDKLEVIVVGDEIHFKPVKSLHVPESEQWAWDAEAVQCMEEGQKLYQEGKLKAYTKDNVEEMFKTWDK